MRTIVATLLLIVMTVPAFAVEGFNVVYVGGSIPQAAAGSLGTIDLARASELLFHMQGRDIEVPFNQISSYEHTQEAAIHLGVLPAIAVGAVKKRRRNHYLRITYVDGSNAPQVAIFEIPKTMPRILMPLLAARAPNASCLPYVECLTLVPARKRQ
jgi:hypothetical protein